MTAINLAIEGMTCAGCVARVERALRAVPAVDLVSVNLADKSARVESHAPLPAARLIEAVESTGFAARPLSPDQSEQALEAASERGKGIQFAVAALLSLPLVAQMAFPLVGIEGMLPPLLQLALALPVQLWAGAQFYRGAWAALKARSATMDSLVALGTSAAFLLSLARMSQALQDSGPASLIAMTHLPLYFEASAVVVTLVLLGRLLEERAKQGASAALRAIMALQPAIARRERDGVLREVPAADLVLGDVVVVQPGERIPVDGRVLAGRSQADEALLTGEARPLAKVEGDAVIAGSVNGDGLLRVEATAVGGEATLARIVELVRAAQASKPPVQRLVDRISEVFVPAVILLAVVSFLGWWIAGAAPSEALLTAVSVLVIACPCALGLATPAAIMVGTGRAARAGILIKDAAAMERARAVTTVVFDKTGTLTEGKPELLALHAVPGGPGEEGLLARTASAQQGSAHPLALAIVQHAMARGLDLQAAPDLTNRPGRGLQTAFADGGLLIGSERLMDEEGVETAALAAVAAQERDRGRSLVWVAETGPAAADPRLLGLLALGDAPRDGARAALASLRALGIRSVVLSGDNGAAVARLGAGLGIDDARGDLLPADKLAAIESLKGEGRVVAMVGDGVNDAPALAAADIGLAMGDGSDAALKTAGIALLRSDPRAVVTAIAASRAIHGKIRQNLFWAFIFNVIALPAAALGLLTPVIAGAAMAASSVTVISNALLLKIDGGAP